jgi:short subunit fatty acids transporter
MGMMVWHGGISGSAPIKINEVGHLSSIMKNSSSLEIVSQIPSAINFNQTIFNSSNLIIFSSIVVVITVLFYLLGKRSEPTEIILLSKKYFANNSNFLYPIYKILKGTWIARKFKAGHQKNLSFVNNNNIFVKSEKLKNNSIYHLNKFQKRLHNLTCLT